jgi:hypothetical protein
MIKSGMISYYGTPAGYTEKDKAVVDRIFQCDELTTWLKSRGMTPIWADGVLERLLSGEKMNGSENAAPLKSVRIWQLDSRVDVRMKFIRYEKMLQHFGAPQPQDYRVAYDGQLDTNDLGHIYERFSARKPPGFSGHPMNMSDVIELYDADGSTFYYVDRSVFRQIGFEPQEQTQQKGMSM